MSLFPEIALPEAAAPVEIIRTAEISPCGWYRYSLSRTWDEAGKTIVFIGLNPSTADASKDDRTIRRCVRFARDNGYGRLTMLNLFAYRSAYPVVLGAQRISRRDIVGADNDAYLRWTPGDRFIAAWGSYPAAVDRARTVIQIIGKPLDCFGTTKDGQPRHPLFIAADAPFVPFWRPNA